MVIVQEEKVTQIRIYSGERYEAVSEVCAGAVCALAGLTKTKAGDGLGRESGAPLSVLEPVLSYAVQLPEDWDPQTALEKFASFLRRKNRSCMSFGKSLFGNCACRSWGTYSLRYCRACEGKVWNQRIVWRGKIVYKETITARWRASVILNRCGIMRRFTCCSNRRNRAAAFVCVRCREERWKKLAASDSDASGRRSSTKAC